MQITIGLPTQGQWVDEMGLSLIGALNTLFQLKYAVHLSPQRGPYLNVSREACLLEAIDARSDRLVFIDTDMVFPSNAIAHLLTHDRDIVGGNYYMKQYPLVSTVKLLGPDGELLTDGQTVTTAIPREPFRCGAVATGFMSINLRRLQQCLAPPVFSYVNKGLDFGGEDVAFCDRARKAGLEVWCDPTIRLGHRGWHTYGAHD